MIKLKKNIIISVMGVDGSGKTTLAKKLHKKFKNSKYLHLKPYILYQDRRTIIKNPHFQKKSSSFLSLLRLLSWLISYKVFFNQNKKKQFYFFDRYAHDVLIDSLRYRHNLSKSLTKFILNFFPNPDLWIFLNPPLKIIKSRKLELSDNEFKRQIEDYKKFFIKQKNVLMLDINIPKTKLTKKITKSITNLIK
ncbi:MAG: Thymidylate kinase [Pelagibacterales bacterium]|nr:Thymidylate kinase [Pelagibacterales bacterium]